MKTPRSPRARDLIGPDDGLPLEDAGERWAIIVGISTYREARLNLRYAHRDALALYDLIQLPTAGAFSRERIVRLIDEDATTANVTKALRTFLKRPARKDLVLIYFACHGAPDPERPANVYLLTHDTDPSDVAGTALPMREIDVSLRENLHAEKVVLIADTCHSASIGSTFGRRSGVDSTAAVNQYLQNLSRAKAGLALITSAEANETALEDVRWGGGHGVFTHFLLEGMRGAADHRPRNGTVTLGELFEYVRTNVMEATGYQQHPAIGTNPFDRNLPVAVVSAGGDVRTAPAPIAQPIVEAAPRMEPRHDRTLRLESGGARDITFSPDGRWIATAELDGGVRVRAAPDGRLLATYDAHRAPPCVLRFDPCRVLLASAGIDRDILLWHPPGDDVPAVLNGHAGAVLALAFHPADSLLASAGYDGTIRLWDTRRMRSIDTFEVDVRPVHALAFDADGSQLVSAGGTGSLDFWDWRTGARVHQVRAHESSILCMSFDARSGLIATGARDTTAKVRDATGKARCTMRGHLHSVLAVGFVGDGLGVLSAGGDDTMRVWDLDTGESTAVIHAGQRSVQAMGVDPGVRVATAGCDGSLALWRLVPGSTAYVRRPDTPALRDGSGVPVQ